MRHAATQIVPASMLLDISRGYEGYREHRQSSWYGYIEGKKWGAIPFAASYLYRGQISRYRPLLPSIARGLDSSEIAQLWRATVSDQAKIVLRVAQSWWFSQELSHHPISTHARSQGLPLDEIALAQHYGIPTGYLDLTDDFNVSAFFATCQPTDQGWEPMKNGIGVIYRVGIKSSATTYERYTPLGPQQLPRPTEQCAWVTELPLCHSLEGWPDVSMLQFQHDRQVGEYFLAMFNGGEKLFPSDPLATVAEEILGCGELPVELADAAIDSFAKDPQGIHSEHVASVRRALSELVTLSGSRRLLTNEQVATLLGSPKWCNQMLSDVKVKWCAVRRFPVDPTESTEPPPSL